jgi:GNAT superfamily N-acetyltransferase
MGSRISPVETDEDLAAAKMLFYEYADFVKDQFGEYIDPDWAAHWRRKLEEEAGSLPGRYAAPGGCLLLASHQDKAAGCVALRKLSDEVCEMRRLFVKPEFRRLGVGNALGEAVIEKGRELGYRLMRLETNRLLQAATALYASLGFEEAGLSAETPIEGMIYMELRL